MPRQSSPGESSVPDPQPTHPGDEQWAGILKHWWNITAGTGTDAGLREKLVDQGLSYLVFGDRALGLVRALSQASGQDADWQAVLQRNLAGLQDSFFQRFAGQGARSTGLATFWGLPLEAWQRAVTALAAKPDNAPPEGLSDLTGLGDWPLEDAEDRRLRRVLEEAGDAYHELLQESARRALVLLEDRLQDRAQRGKPVNRLRVFYNLWVEAGEQAHAELLDRTVYSERYGAMLNALLRLKHHRQDKQRRLAAEQGVATDPGALASLGTRLQETRRQVRDLQERLQGLQHLEQEVDRLRRRVEELETGHRP